MFLERHEVHDVKLLFNPMLLLPASKDFEQNEGNLLATYRGKEMGGEYRAVESIQPLYTMKRDRDRVGVDYKSLITITIMITVPIKLSITIMITVPIKLSITITITIIRLRLRLQLLVYHGNDSRLVIRHVHLQYYHA